MLLAPRATRARVHTDSQFHEGSMGTREFLPAFLPGTFRVLPGTLTTDACSQEVSATY